MEIKPPSFFVLSLPSHLVYFFIFNFTFQFLIVKAMEKLCKFFIEFIFVMVKDASLLDVILQQLSEDFEELQNETNGNLHPAQIFKLSVSACYFLWDNVIWDLLNSGPIGLSIMVVLSESYLKNLEKHAIESALKFGTATKTFCRYLNDSHA